MLLKLSVLIIMTFIHFLASRTYIYLTNNPLLYIQYELKLSTKKTLELQKYFYTNITNNNNDITITTATTTTTNTTTAHAQKW